MMKNFLIWVTAISLAIITGSAALGAIAKNKSPELALSLFPKNGYAAQAMASRLTMTSVIENKGNFPDSVNPAWSALALRAFKSEAVSPDSIAVVALSRTEDVRRELMQKAFELSRRQKIVTSWLIADSGQSNDLSGLLKYYDTLLRTSSSATTVVIPVMVTALADDKSIKPFTKLLSKNPPWTNRFWRQVVRTPLALSNAVQLRKNLHRTGESAYKYSDQELIIVLIKEEKFVEAEELYNLLSQGSSNKSLIKNGSFGRESKYPPMDWQLTSTGEYGAAVTNGNLQISAIANSGGLFARQLVRLPSEILEINTRFTTEIPDTANVEMRLSCAETLERPPLTVRLPLTTKVEQRQISNERSGCRYFWLDIIGRASENGNGFDIVLDTVSVLPE